MLTSCETPYDDFPPKPFAALPALASDPAALGQLLSALEDPEIRRLPAAFGLLVKHPLETAISDSYALPCAHDREQVLRAGAERPVLGLVAVDVELDKLLTQRVPLALRREQRAPRARPND